MGEWPKHLAEWPNYVRGLVLDEWKKHHRLRALFIVVVAILLALLGFNLFYPEQYSRIAAWTKRGINAAASRIVEATKDQPLPPKPQINQPAGPTKGQEVLIPYASLQRISNASEDTFHLLPYAPGVFALEWKFSAYLVKAGVKQPDGTRQLQQTVPMSELMTAGRKIRFAAIVLKKSPTGVLEGSRFFFSDMTPSKQDWLQAKLVLDPGELLIGTLLAPPFSQNLLGNIYGGLIGDMLDAFYLSLDDPSFQPIAVKKLNERYGVISLRGIFGPIAAGFLEPILQDNQILALQVTGPRTIVPLEKPSQPQSNAHVSPLMSPKE